MDCLSLSVVIITLNEEANLARTLASVAWADEIVVVDSGSTDRTREVAESFHAKFYVEPWKGFAAQKNSALAKATGDWILSLDADEEVEPALAEEIRTVLSRQPVGRRLLDSAQELLSGPLDQARRLLSRPQAASVSPRRWPVRGPPRARRHCASTARRRRCKNNLLHHAYPTLENYIEHMNRYSSLGAQMAVAKRARGFSFVDIVVRPKLTFLYNYFLRLGFLDGREGPAAAPLPRNLRELEVRQGVGNQPQEVTPGLAPRRRAARRASGYLRAKVVIGVRRVDSLSDSSHSRRSSKCTS